MSPNRLPTTLLLVALLASPTVAGCDESDPETDDEPVAEAEEPDPTPTDEQREARRTALDDVGAAVADAVDRLENPPLPPGLAEPSLGTFQVYHVVSSGHVPDEVEATLDEQDRQPSAPYDPDEWPAHYDWPEVLEVLTSQGPVELDIEEVRRIHSRGEGMIEDTVLRTESLADTDGEASRTFYAGPGVFAGDARVADGGDAEAVDEDLAARIWERFVDDLQEHNREALEEAFDQLDDDLEDPQLDEYVEQYHIDFSPDWSRLVVVGLHDPEVLPFRMECLKAGYLVDDEGNEITTGVEPEMGFHCIGPVSTAADLDGDGYWGVLYHSGTEPHPFSIRMLVVDDGEPTTEHLKSVD